MLADVKNNRTVLQELLQFLRSSDFTGKLLDEHLELFQSKISRFRDIELAAVFEKIREEAEKRRRSGKTLLISKLEDIAALTKMEIMLRERAVPVEVINLLLLLLVNKSSNFSVPIFNGRVDELFDGSVENAVVNIVLEKLVTDKSRQGRTKEMKDLFEKKLRDTETFVHLTQVIDMVDLNESPKIKSIFMTNLLAEAMKRDETMRKSESITMKDLINLYLLSKIQLELTQYGYPNETLEGIIINRLSQSNNIRRQFRILDHIISETARGTLNIELGSKTEKLEWLKLINELEISIALAQYEEKLSKDKFKPLSEDIKAVIHDTLMTENIADQTIAAISFARRLDNPDESLHEPGKLAEVAAETQYLTSMIFRVKGFQIKEVYEFVELIGELDVKDERYHKTVEYFQYELPHIDKSVLKEEDPDIKKAALTSRYLSARMMSLFNINPRYLSLAPEFLTLDTGKIPAEFKNKEGEWIPKIDYFNEIRKRLGFFNKAERAFMTMNRVEHYIRAERLELSRANMFRIMENINDIELSLATAEYIKAGTITRGQDDANAFTAPYVESKIKALFQDESIRMIEKEAVEKNIIPESILAKAEEEGNLEDTLLDIKNYAVYLVTRRFDKPEYPRHLQRALNLILALIQDAIGWRHFENTQIRAKQEITPLLEEYYHYMNLLLDALHDDTNPDHEEVISKLRDDDYFAITDNRDSLEAGKKSAPQVRIEFNTLMNDGRFQDYLARAYIFAEHSPHEEWAAYRNRMEEVKKNLNEALNKTCTVIDSIIDTLKSTTQSSVLYKDAIQTLRNRYLTPLEKLEYQLNTHRKPPMVVKIEYDRIVNSDKFKVFLNHTYELAQTVGN